jgi:hypothetical protein
MRQSIYIKRSIKTYNRSAIASTLETMQGSTGIMMRH